MEEKCRSFKERCVRPDKRINAELLWVVILGDTGNTKLLTPEVEKLSNRYLAFPYVQRKALIFYDISVALRVPVKKVVWKRSLTDRKQRTNHGRVTKLLGLGQRCFDFIFDVRNPMIIQWQTSERSKLVGSLKSWSVATLKKYDLTVVKSLSIVRSVIVQFTRWNIQ